LKETECLYFNKQKHNLVNFCLEKRECNPSANQLPRVFNREVDDLELYIDDDDDDDDNDDQLKYYYNPIKKRMIKRMIRII